MLLRFFSFTAASAISPRLAPLTAISSSSEPSSLLELSVTSARRTLRFDDADMFFFMGLLFADDPLFFGGLALAVGVRICLDVLPVTAAALAATAPSRPSLLVLRSCLSALLDFSCLLVSLRTVLMPCNRRPELSEKPFWIVLVSKYNPKRKSQSLLF